MTLSRWLGSAALVSLLASACSGTDMEQGSSGSETVASSEAEIAVGDQTGQVCFNANGPAQCNMHDGVFSYTSGMCTIWVQQQCAWVGGQCRCLVKVIDTQGPCGTKGWGAFFNHC